MSSKDTEGKLIRIIAEHYLDGGRGSLTIQVTSERAGISRQAFSRNYGHLKPYVLGKLPVEELINGSIEDLRGLLTKCQYRVRELQKELVGSHASCNEAIEKARDSYITTLMNSDIALKSSDQIRETLEKQALHNEILVKEIQRLQLEVTIARAREIDLAGRVEKVERSSTEIIYIEPDLTLAFQNYSKTNDHDTFEDAKEKALGHMLKKLSKLCQARNTSVILFVDRYLSNFRDYVDEFLAKQQGTTIIVRVPLFNRIELKLFAAKLPKTVPVAVHVPVCTNEASIKAQRRFSFRDVPDIEFIGADKMVFPSIQDGYVEVTVFRTEN